MPADDDSRPLPNGFREELDYLRRAGLEAELFGAVRTAAHGAQSASPQEALRIMSERLARLADDAPDEPPKTLRRRVSAASRSDDRAAEPAQHGPPIGHGPPGGDAGGSVWSMVAGRTGWLAFFLCGLLLCERVMHAYESLLHAELELAFFVPLIIGHGGNSGGQAVSTVIRAIGRRSTSGSEAARTVAREAVAGLVQSLLLALVVGPALHYFLHTSRGVSAVVGMTLPLLGLFANSMGALLPYAVAWAGLDPAVIVGPLMTTLVDTLGLGLYLTCATILLK
jgi:cation transporter-like permease